MDLSPKRIVVDSGSRPDRWSEGFQLSASSGPAMQCDRCAALVRQDPGSAKRHLEWHKAIETR